jgi:uncharacterized membrane protein
MIVRSMVLFAHIVGMLLLFIGLSLEWLSLESLRRSTTPAHSSSWARIYAAQPRVYGAAFVLILVSGMFLAARAGIHELPWVRLSFGGLLFMGLLGALVRSRARAIRDAGRDSHEWSAGTLQHYASHPIVRLSLRVRAAIGLAIVYLMVGKPDLSDSLFVLGGALAVGLAASVPYSTKHHTTRLKAGTTGMESS